jgi:hypothetical protein
MTAREILLSNHSREQIMDRLNSITEVLTLVAERPMGMIGGP